MKQLSRHENWLFHLTLLLLSLLVVWVAVLIWKIISSETMFMPVAVYKPKQVRQPVSPSLPKALHSSYIVEKDAVLTFSNEERKKDSIVSNVRLNTEKLSKDIYGVTLIIDDMGYDVGALKRLLALSIPLSISILPNASHAIEVARLTHQAGQMVMLHLPMEPIGERYRKRMDASFLKVGMNEKTVRAMMLKDLEKIPYVQGINNHMGSRLTSLIVPMTWVMQMCREKSLFFVDSKTSSKSLAARVAKQYGLRWGSRAIFLDDSLDVEAMQKSWEKMKQCVQRKKHCIVIAHPHQQTLAFLEGKLAMLRGWPVHPLYSMLHSLQ